MDRKQVLVDAREFIPGKMTGIGRFLEGLLDALAEAKFEPNIFLASFNEDFIPSGLKNRNSIKPIRVPLSFLGSETALWRLIKQDFTVFISPYPKLPFFGRRCAAVHTIHDVLDLTHPAYRKRPKAFFDRFRLKLSLRHSALTWYVSSWSLKETRELIGFAGRRPKVRHNAIDDRFSSLRNEMDRTALKSYALEPGYILTIGNGLPHKNLGILLGLSDRLRRPLVLAGVSRKRQAYWEKQYPGANAIRIEHIDDKDLPAIIRASFCLAHPSTAEGYGYPPMEALACGVPAVVSDIPVLVEVTGGNALLAPPHDPGSWIAAFESLEDHDVYRNLVAKGLKWTEPLKGRRGWKSHIEDIERLIEPEVRFREGL